MKINKTVFTSIFLSAAVLCAAGAAVPLEIRPEGVQKNLRLVWHDEFDGTCVDTSKWDIPTRSRQGSCLWIPSNVSVTGGCAVISVRRTSEDDWTYRYQSACLRTRADHDPARTLYEFCGGYAEIRARLPRIRRSNYWAAFWLMSGDVLSGTANSRAGSEIDIMESFGRAWPEPFINHALHWGGYAKNHNMANFRTPFPAESDDGEFHTWGLYWDSERYVFYFDGKPTAETDASGLGRPGRPLSGGTAQRPAYIKISCEAAPWAVPENRWLSPLPSEPDSFAVDYVRIYQ